MNASVICPVFNEMEVTMNFVMNMLKYVKPPHQLVIVANGCTDATMPFLNSMTAAKHPITVVESKKNLGFAGGNNLGAKSAVNPIHIFLSNDVVADGEFIPYFTETLDRNPNAVTGVKLLTHNTGWNTYATTQEMKIAETVFPPKSAITVPYIEGWCVAVDSRRAHYNRAGKGQVGGLWDERYSPCDFEDVDVSMQAWVEGRFLISVPAPLKHEHTGNTANKIAGGRLAATLKNQQAFMEKWGLVKP